MEFFEGWSGIGYLAGLLGVGIAIELLLPWRRKTFDVARWLRNASMAFYGTIILSLFPFLAAGAAALGAEASGVGLLNIVTVPFWVELVIAIIVFDFISFAEHRALHRWYFLWRAHRTHHSDTHIDATTSLRFHPFEAVFRACVEVVVVFSLGLPVEGLLLSFAISAVANTFTHMNMVLPVKLERAMSWVFVTPYLHRLHHSTKIEHQYSNFGTIFTVWDRLAGCYRGSWHLTPDESFGLDENETGGGETFAALALDPFRTPKNARLPRPGSLENLQPTEPPIEPRS